MVSTNSDYIALAASICLGMLFVIVLPFRARVRALLVAAYAPLAFDVLVVYSLLFVGFAFGDWAVTNICMPFNRFVDWTRTGGPRVPAIPHN
jgi:hypothetical protein